MCAKTVVLICLTLGMLACSASKGTNRAGYSRDLITKIDIDESTAKNAYELISSLRPHWLRGRGTKSLKYQAQASYPVIYVNETQYGDIDSLSRLSLHNISEIRYLNPGDATFRFGLDHAGGAILISML